MTCTSEMTVLNLASIAGTRRVVHKKARAPHGMCVRVCGGTRDRTGVPAAESAEVSSEELIEISRPSPRASSSRLTVERLQRRIRKQSARPPPEGGARECVSRSQGMRSFSTISFDSTSLTEAREEGENKDR